MKAYPAPFGVPFCEAKGNVCDNQATHTVSLSGVGSLGGRYCLVHAQGIVDAVNREINRPPSSEGSDV